MDDTLSRVALSISNDHSSTWPNTSQHRTLACCDLFDQLGLRSCQCKVSRHRAHLKSAKHRDCKDVAEHHNLKFGLPTQPMYSSQSNLTANLLGLCPSLVGFCYGCSQSLKLWGIVANSPHDLVIVSRMKRSYRDPSPLEMRSREANFYFHVQESCIRRKQPYFISQMVAIPHGLLALLKTEHLHDLREFGLHIKTLHHSLKRILQL